MLCCAPARGTVLSTKPTDDGEASARSRLAAEAFKTSEPPSYLLPAPHTRTSRWTRRIVVFGVLVVGRAPVTLLVVETVLRDITRPEFNKQSAPPRGRSTHWRVKRNQNIQDLARAAGRRRRSQLRAPHRWTSYRHVHDGRRPQVHSKERPKGSSLKGRGVPAGLADGGSSAHAPSTHAPSTSK